MLEDGRNRWEKLEIPNRKSKPWIQRERVEPDGTQSES